MHKKIIGLGVIATGQLGGMDWISTMQSVSGSSVAFPMKLAVALPLSYHFLGAIRHTVRYNVIIYP